MLSLSLVVKIFQSKIFHCRVFVHFSQSVNQNAPPLSIGHRVIEWTQDFIRSIFKIRITVFQPSDVIMVTT